MTQEHAMQCQPDRTFVADLPIMKRVLQQARRAAKVDTTVLISGEAGTGRTMLAMEIHRDSVRHEGPFVRFSAAEALSDGSLFGLVNDTTNGCSIRSGAIQHAEGGTLMIDEIAALWPTSQARLLRAMETGAVAPLGASRERAIDVRIIATTSKDLQSEVQAGRFRQDLLYRIGVLPIRLPPLRMHRGDIPGFVREFLRRINRRLPDGYTLGMEPRQIRILTSLDWPENVRQLQEVVENMASPQTGRGANDVLACGSDHTPLALIEKETILAALDSHNGNRMRAAESLGISVRTLQRRLRQWHIGQ